TIAGFATAAWVALHRGGDERVMRLAIELPRDLPAEVITRVALSPGGDRVAFVSVRQQSRLYSRRLDAVDPVAFPGTEGASSPTFSPDGRWLAYVVGTTLFKVPVEGGAPVTIATLPHTANGASWSEHDEIVLGSSDGLIAVSANAGEPRWLTHK